MRELKLRAWNKIGKEWLFPYPHGFCLFGEVTCFDLIMQQMKERYPEKQTLSMLNDIVVVQFTGLRDKNGKEVYSGDILKTPHFLDIDGWQYLYHVVEWSEKYCGWFAKNPRSGHGNDGSLQLWVYAKNSDFVVCGNIHENPELVTP